MSRVNIGVHPKYLADQHLIAESVEITMITGGLKKQGFKIKSAIPTQFSLGVGHINFFKNKILYLKNRLDLVNSEMKRRNFNPGTKIDLSEYPIELINDWTPSYEDSKIIRARIISRLITRARGQSGIGYYRYWGEYLTPETMNNLIRCIRESKVNNI